LCVELRQRRFLGVIDQQVSRATIYRKIHDFGIVVEPTTTVGRHRRGVR
jgi:hypothetical protein